MSVDCQQLQTWSLPLKQQFQRQKDLKFIAHHHNNLDSAEVSNHYFLQKSYSS